MKFIKILINLTNTNEIGSAEVVNLRQQECRRKNVCKALISKNITDSQKKIWQQEKYMDIIP